MTSSTLSGDRRWASSRRSGMTVLGKVAVPKPINLPSQRLENHGLDPNVEIVPKGTLSWGSKSSSSSNAWGSSTLSPNTDGGSGSPSHLSARPSSGGSGTRPSTAGSDRAHEPANAWGSNSRPSSASGALASSQSSLASLRPRSAETRPGSSQLSRFAETIPENSGAWGASGTAEKLGMTSSKNDGFSLASGDFPTLGSEKDSTGKNAELQDHGSQGRPGSSSGVAPMKERTGPSTVGLEDGVRPSMEKWHADPQGPHPPYPNTGIPPQHYDAWHGPPINNHPGGVWYRGPPGGPPYGPPPGAFPMEPFPYYRPQIPGNALGNPQPVPPPGAGPRGPHPKNGDMYRGPMPDAFVRPGMPIRPPFYPGPVAYEGYYGPPMGYCNSNERDIPFMGMPAGPSPHNRYPGQNAPDHGGSHARPSGYGPPGKALAAEHLESGHPHDVRGPYKVLLKQHDGWEGKDEENRWEDNATATVEKGDRRRTSSWENDWKADQRKEEEVRIRRDQSPGQIIDHHGGDSILGKVKSSDAVDNAKAYDDISAKRVEYSEVPATTKDSNLIQQIEGLNAKARASDGRLESVSVYNREEQKNKSQVVNAKAKHFANEVATGSRAAFTDKMPASGMSEPTSNEVGFSAADKSLDVPAGGAGVNRRSTHGMHTRPDHHRGRGRFNLQDADGWRKRPPYTDSSNVKPATDSENPSNVNMQDHMSLEASEKSVLLSYPQARDEGESMQPVFDPSDSQAKRAMMRELAKQRVKQRQKEEEERARDQKAKALAKLEELNRRTQMAEGLTQKLESVPDSATQSKQEECQTLAEESILTSRSEVTSLAPVSNPIIDADVGQSSTGGLEKPTVFNNQQPLVSTKNVHKATTDMCEQSLPVQQRVNSPDASINNHPQVSDGSTSKQKRVGYKKRDNNSMDKNSSEKPISTSTIELPKHTDAAVDVAPSAETVVKENVSSPEFISAQNVVNEPSVQQRRKNNRSGKSKHKMEEASSIAPLPSGISKDTNLSSTSVEGSKPKSSEIESDPRPVQSLTDSKDGNRSSEQDSAPNEEVHGRMNNQWKSQHSRRMPRNAQTHRSAVHSNDAVVWAPVRPHNKVEVIEEESHKPVVEAVAPQVKNDPQVQSNTRSKRAEMERYIPKPVAKEMAQQVISQQPVALSENQYAAEETGGRADSGSHGVECSQPVGFAVGKVENSTESRNDGRQSRQGRGHGSWRQRASSEATFQGLQDGQYSNQGKNTRKMTEHNQQQKPDLSLVKEQQPKYDEWNTSDGWNMPEAPDSSAPPVVPVVRDQGVTGRGKRQAFKGHKGGGSNHDFDHKKINNGEAEKASTQSPVHEMAQSDLPATPKENRVGDRSTSQWQPKSSAINNRGTRPDNDQNAGPEIGRANKKDTAQGKVSLPSQPEKETTGSVTQPLKDQYIPDKRNVEEAHNAGHYESKRERKVGSLKGRPQSPNQGLDLPMEAPPSNVDNRNEQRTTSGLRKNGNQHNRFGRGHESRGEWGSSGQEIRQQHNPPANRDRQRHNNSHYEYQPVGPQNNSRPNNPEGPKDGTHTGGRFRDRGQSHSRRGGGNFHGRQSGAVRVDGGYE
ncbi:hypothetical protein COLO4_30100 [Corchorus olitorius]|uniref:BAT2 N-terminal domain-containing protein n=1 Tax=Corchorus olitorius TaxID=93759 RepID=A0A1R3HB99_9ROSI|nr:hypothetical protein COLO4_30100 [Corchorus olitorius]